MKGWMKKGDTMRCKLKGRMNKDGHYDLQINEWMKTVAL